MKGSSRFGSERPRSSPGLGIHHLLEESISRSKLSFGATDDATIAAIRHDKAPKQRRASSAVPVSPVEKGKKADVSSLQTPVTQPQTASKEPVTTSVPFGEPERTAVPERRQLEYAYAYNKGDKANDQTNIGKKSTTIKVGH